MTRLVWETGMFETGVDRGVLYPANGYGEVWNGLISVQESPSMSEIAPLYQDGVKVRNKTGREEYLAQIQAYMYPDWILGRNEFGFSYRSGHKIHLIYQARVHLNERTYQTSEHTPFTLDLTARPLHIPEAKHSAHLIVDTSKAHPQALLEFEDLLYGTDLQVAQIPPPLDVFSIFEAHALLKVIDHGDGTFTIEGPDEAIEMLDLTTFQTTWPSAVYLDEDTYRIRSY